MNSVVKGSPCLQAASFLVRETKWKSLQSALGSNVTRRDDIQQCGLESHSAVRSRLLGGICGGGTGPERTGKAKPLRLKQGGLTGGIKVREADARGMQLGTGEV